MITEEKYLEAKKIVEDYENSLLNIPVIIKSLPSDAEIHKKSLSVCKLESQLVRAIACCYHDIGAKWMKEEVIKQGDVL